LHDAIYHFVEIPDPLHDSIRTHGKLIISYSGGVDSAFLLRAAAEVLGPDGVRPIMIVNEAVPEVQRRAALENAEGAGVEVQVITVPIDSIEGFRGNPHDRCARCKRAMYGSLLAHSGGWPVADGATATDVGKGRIGLTVADELGIVHPLAEAALSDIDVRRLSRELDLPFAGMPSTTCLATRFLEGEDLDPALLRSIERSEEFIMDLGFPVVRVRLWGGPPLVQVAPGDVPRLMGPTVMEAVRKKLEGEGFDGMEIDPAGYSESPD